MESTESQTIQAINRDTVHRICSGQVVLSLAIAVKELIENALDAGATIIDIQLKEYGSDLIRVADNGSGVEKVNFEALTLKHYTSKIRQFDDLSHLGTLGFRGEALSSLCALSDLTILTKHISSEYATEIKYNRNGKITSENLSAREVGTTVTLENLFSTLPVRRKEFVKNLKREFNKMCQLLYAYCLVSKGVKFSCTNVTKKGNKNLVVSTDGLSTVRDNIVNVFGAKQISSLIEVSFIKATTEILSEYCLDESFVEDENPPFDFEFFISSVLHGSGRSSSDRQFFYINSRPCEPPKLSKLINEVYKQYNSNQLPFVYLNVTTNSCSVDVNVTPDKRQVFLEKEKILLAIIKASLIDAFKAFPSTYKLQNLELSQCTKLENFFERKPDLKRSFTDSGLKKGSILQKFQKRSKTENDTSPITGFLSKNKSNSDDLSKSFGEESLELIEGENELVEEIKIVCAKKPRDSIIDITKLTTTTPKLETNENSTEQVLMFAEKLEVVKAPEKGKIDEIINGELEKVPEKKLEAPEIEPKVVTIDKPKKIESVEDDLEISINTTVTDRSVSLKSVTLDTSFEDIKKLLEVRKNRAENDDVQVKFRCKIDPTSNKSAEEELQKQFSKEDFSKMTIIGQFNLGFIIAKLKNDLFIIDQHASDEKYNFEQLQANTIMENQVLVNPKPLQLTAGNESLLIENEDIFQKNGFNFKIDYDAPAMKKVSLTSVPLSKNVVFGKDDIDEMLFMLQDSNHTMCRPSRIRAMFASRACRKSIMIGKSLTQNDMRKLVDHMGEIHQPWNCPHGRPTMRHLINLDLIQKDDN